MAVDTYAAPGLFFDSLEPKTPNCLLLDFQMPEMSGLDVLKHLSRRCIHMKTIVMTGNDEISSRDACMNSGAIAYLRKPLAADQLVEIIENVCGTSLRNTLPSSG